MDMNLREAKNCIPKKNQEYVLRVAFNVLGSYNYTAKYIEEVTDEFNDRFPVGYRCLNNTPNWYQDEGTQYWLILVIVLIIYFMCSILFESFRLPFVIITLIPVSFIGTFLTFYFSGVKFGTGGFASLVLLSGLVVNAGIYIINEYNNQTAACKAQALPRVNLYVKAYNHDHDLHRSGLGAVPHRRAGGSFLVLFRHRNVGRPAVFHPGPDIRHAHLHAFEEGCFRFCAAYADGVMPNISLK